MATRSIKAIIYTVPLVMGLFTACQVSPEQKFDKAVVIFEKMNQEIVKNHKKGASKISAIPELLSGKCGITKLMIVKTLDDYWVTNESIATQELERNKNVKLVQSAPKSLETINNLALVLASERREYFLSDNRKWEKFEDVKKSFNQTPGSDDGLVKSIESMRPCLNEVVQTDFELMDKAISGINKLTK